MSVGVPTVVSNNTGHVDLVASGGCFPLTRQRRLVAAVGDENPYQGWGESDVSNASRKQRNMCC